MDPSMLGYRVLVVLCAAVVLLSTIWWWMVDGTSVVFRMLWMLAAGIGVDTQIQAHSRALWLSGKCEAFDSFRTSWLWESRQYGEIFALAYLLAVIVSRMGIPRSHYVP